MATARLAALLPGAASWLTSLQPEDGHPLLSQEQTALMAELIALLVPRLHSQGGPYTFHILYSGLMNTAASRVRLAFNVSRYC